MNEKKTRMLFIGILVLCVLWLGEVCAVTVELSKAKALNRETWNLLIMSEETLDYAKKVRKDAVVLSNAAQEVLKDAY